MAQLSKQEKAMLEKLQAKAEAPDAPAIGRSMSVTVDLGDPKQVALAQRYGFLDPDDDGDDDDGDGDGDDDGDEAPKRRGYFGDKS